MSIPTKSVRHHRSMASSDTCSICNSATYTWRHALLDCHMVRVAWALVDDELVEHMTMNRTEDARLWLFSLFDTLNQQELARVLVTLWAIWWAIRRAIHDDEFQNPMSTISFINKYFEEIEVASVCSKKSSVLSRSSNQSQDG